MFERRISDIAWCNIYEYLRTLLKIHTKNEAKMRQSFESGGTGNVFWSAVTYAAKSPKGRRSQTTFAIRPFYNHKTSWEKGIMFHPMRWISKTNWLVRQEIIWDITIAANTRGWSFWQVDERIYWLYKPKYNKLIGDELKSNHA
jgi:hypothetical protein